MDCSRIREILFENAGAAIPEDIREQVEAHLAGCEPCAAQANALEKQSRALRDLPKMDAPSDFLAKVRQQVEKPPILTAIAEKLSTFFSGGHFFRMAGLAATVVLVIMVSRIMLQEGGRVNAPAPPAPTAAEAPAPAPMPAEPGAGGMMKEYSPRGAIGGAATPQSTPPPGKEANTEARQKSVEITISFPGAPLSKGAGTNAPAKRAESAKSSLRAMAPRMESEDARSPAEKNDAAKLKKSPMQGTPPETQRALGDIKRLIAGANGKILSEKTTGDKELPGTLLTEIPAENYQTFLNQLRQLGDVQLEGNEKFDPSPGTTVSVTLRFVHFE